MREIIEEKTMKFLRIFGIVIRRANSHRATMFDVLNHAAEIGFKPQSVIDVGVAYGTFDLYRTFKNARILLVEPLKEWEDVLKKICKKYKAEYVIAGASDKPGTAIINVHNNLSSSSFFRESDGNVVDGTPREIPLITLDNVCKEKKVNGPYLLKIDVQGFELKVLSGAKEVLKNTEMILLEVSLFQFYENGPQFFEVVQYMMNQGFVVYDIFGGLNRPYDGALAQIDISFVKENGLFRRSHNFQRS